MLDSRENFSKELGMEFLKNLIVRTNKVNFMVSWKQKGGSVLKGLGGRRCAGSK